jgi:hypothetical protein
VSTLSTQRVRDGNGRVLQVAVRSRMSTDQKVPLCSVTDIDHSLFPSLQSHSRPVCTFSPSSGKAIIVLPESRVMILAGRICRKQTGALVP